MGQKHKYAVVLDAGSSGTRVYVYEYKRADWVREHGDEADLARLPDVKTKKSWHKKVKPGISTFGSKPDSVGPDHLHGLVKFAKDTVPKGEWEDTPIFLLATAGMRLLPAAQRTALLDETCAYFRAESTFQLPDCGVHVQVIPGETEGLYGWIAANYLLGGFDAPEKHDHGKGHHTYGFLDMGGASAQIAFAPNATEAQRHANDLKLLRLRKASGEAVEYGVFVTTWLGFGANEARRRYVDKLLETYPTEYDIPDPCLPKGLLLTTSGEEVTPGPMQPHLVGTGAFAECLGSTYPLLEKDKECLDSPCLLNGVHTPAIDFSVNHFVGVSEYWHTTHEIFAMAHKDKAYDFATYQKQVSEFCSRDWSSIKKDVAMETWGDNVDEKRVEEVCFKASWLINMLHDGIGIPRVGLDTGKDSLSNQANNTKAVLDKAKDRGFLDPFQAVDKIDGTEVSWTLGKMVLYASSQMPPSNGAMAVGFGSNIPGSHELPADFQRPSGSLFEPLPVSTDTSDDDDWHDRLLRSSYSRRLPGILIFLLILALAVYLLCGRERRLTLLNKVLSMSGRRSPGRGRGKRRRGGGSGNGLSILGSKLFHSSSEPAYERVMEEADDPAFHSSDDDMELAEVLASDGSVSSSSNHEPKRTGRTSGMATPSVRGLSPDLNRSSPKKSKGYFDLASTSAGGAGGGLGITPFERGGLMVRTESKERLAPRQTPSRTASPRRSPFITPFGKENVE